MIYCSSILALWAEAQVAVVGAAGVKNNYKKQLV